MVRVQFEKIRGEIVAIRPQYTSTGNATVIYLREGEVIDPRGCKTVANALAACYAIDRAAQRRNLEKCLGRKGILPFHLGAERVFIPLKMRQAKSENDLVYGYLDVSYIGDVDVIGKKQCLLSLKDGRQIEVLSSRNTIRQSQHMGLRLLELLNAERGEDPVIKSIQQLFAEVINAIREIWAIKMKVESIEEMVAEQEERYTTDKDEPL
jgi:hypothetical protein